MARRYDNQNAARKSDSLPETRETSSVHSTDKTDDDLIVLLAERRENARARQVFEWEKARRQSSPQIFRHNAA